MPELPGSARRVLKATYVPLNVDTSATNIGRAVQKYGYVSQLRLQPGEVAAVRKLQSSDTGGNTTRALWQKLARFEGMPLPSQLPAVNTFAKTDVADLLGFGHSLIALRTQRSQQGTVAAASRSSASVSTDSQTLALSLLNTSLAATNAMAQSAGATPIGMLNLERLEMVPAGIQRGELIATIPLAPLEQTAVVQKEWSVTSQEFTSIVTDSLDNYSETGVTENTELAQATTNQNQHNSQFNINATVSGNIKFATIASASSSVTSGFTSQDQNSSSATESAKHAISTTKQASTRVKQEHKVTISTSTVTGTSETTTRNLQNSSPTDPMRIDYFSLMRKWHVSLYRYGLRMTYDIVIAEPASTFRQQYKQLADLQSQLSTGFLFNLPYSAITPANYENLATQFQAQLPPPPKPGPTATYTAAPKTGKGWFWCDIPISIPDGYWVTDVQVVLNVGQIDSGTHVGFEVIGSGWSETGYNAGEYSQDLTVLSGYMLHYTGSQTVSLFLDDVNDSTAHVVLTVKTEATPDAIAQWQASAWSALYNAAQTGYYAKQQNIQAQIQTIQQQIAGVDTLTLRREENDEITKGVLRWLLGPGFDFMPASVSNLFPASGASWGIGFPTNPSNALGLSLADWSTVGNYEQMVRFVNDAIDWDNTLYFLYSYFWDVPLAWENIRNIQHPDSTRQAFLRAGSARVVLTVRKGWEAAWVQFVEGGEFGTGPLPALHPYLTIAQEIQDYDNTNYPGIPPANPGGPDLPDDDDYVATASTAAVASSGTSVSIPVASSAGFIVGYDAVIDSWDSGVQETQTILAIPDTTHVVVSTLTYAHAASVAIIQAGEKGLLIAEWFEYTPNSGTDIAVTSNLATIA